MNNRFKDKRAIVTGAAGGIGFNVAKRFGQDGGQVCIMDLDEVAAKNAVEGLKMDGIKALYYRLDVTNESAVSSIFPKAIETMGGIDVLVNNAGIADFGSVENTELIGWERVMAANVTATYLCSRATIPFMKENGGAIVNIGSVAGKVGIPNMAAYCAAKGAVISLTKQMAAQYSAQGIRVNCVSPGTVADTSMGRQMFGADSSKAAQEKRLEKYPVGRFGESLEIADAILFLASDQATFCCGADFAVDGGMTAI